MYSHVTDSYVQSARFHGAFSAPARLPGETAHFVHVFSPSKFASPTFPPAGTGLVLGPGC